jgi:hypothetical protein
MASINPHDLLARATRAPLLRVLEVQQATFMKGFLLMPVDVFLHN